MQVTKSSNATYIIWISSLEWCVVLWSGLIGWFNRLCNKNMFSVLVWKSHDLLFVQVRLPFLYAMCSLCLLFLQWSSTLNGVSRYRCRWGYTSPGQEMIMLGILVVDVSLFLRLVDRMFCNLLVVYERYVLISVCKVILRMTVLYIILATSSSTSELLKFKCFV